MTDGPYPAHGAFVAFHGSWNRAPSPQEGYNVVFAPVVDGEQGRIWRVVHQASEQVTMR